jgi:hypothetical protein
VILGALKQGRDYQSTEVFLAASAFTEDLARALAIFLHEHAIETFDAELDVLNTKSADMRRAGSVFLLP